MPAQTAAKGTSGSKFSKLIDELTGFEVGDDFERFDQKFDIYCRSLWDDEVKSKRTALFFESYFMPFVKPKKTDGFSQKDFAFRNAAWHLSNVMRDIDKAGEYRTEHPEGNRKEGFWNYLSSHDIGAKTPYEYSSPDEATLDLKKVAKFCGVDRYGITAFDERWMYKTIYSKDTGGEKPPEIPDDVNHVIMVAEPMEQELIKTVPSALSGAATGLGYTYDTVAIITIAQYIRNMGYRAYASLNDSALAIPLAVQAGLGEVGRHGLLITEEYGPRLRLGKIFTDMPLINDQPKSFGVKAFCDKCDRCAAACPPKALPFGAPSFDKHSVSNTKGVKKWTPVAEKCFKFWVNQNTDCLICIRACPFNRDFTKWWNRAWLKIAQGPMRAFALKLDDWTVERGRMKASHWWRPELAATDPKPKRKKPKKKSAKSVAKS